MYTPNIMQVSPLLMERTRLAIITTLAAEDEPMTFGILLERLGLTQGNLSVHARKLEEDALIAIEKKFIDRKPVTSYACTNKGRSEIRKYLEAVEDLLARSMVSKGEKK